MKNKKWIFLLALIFSLPVFASSSVKSSLVVEQVKKVKAQEYFGDDLYFDISVFKVKEPTMFFRVPKFPINWPSSKVKFIKGIVLWQGEIKDKQKVNFVVSLVDQDAKPFNPDDIVGVVKVMVENVDGQLKANWQMPNVASSAKDSKAGDVQKFSFSSSNGDYEVYLSVRD